MIEKKNYYGIDLLKFIMAVCVVAIHTQPLYSVQSIVVQRLFDTITSLAVPYFFSVSGFLLFSKIDADISCRKNMEVCKRYLSRVLSLYVIWNIIYPACLTRKYAAEIWGRNGLGQNGKAQITADTLRWSKEMCSTAGMYCYFQ